MYEEGCIEAKMKQNSTSPVNKQIIRYVKPCALNEKHHWKSCVCYPNVCTLWKRKL